MRWTAQRSDEAAADRALEASLHHVTQSAARIAWVPGGNALAAGRRLAGKDPE